MASFQTVVSGYYSHSIASTLGSTPFTTPNGPVFPAAVAPKSGQLDVPRILLPAVAVDGNHRNFISNGRTRYSTPIREKDSSVPMNRSLGSSLHVNTEAANETQNRGGSPSPSTLNSRHSGLVPMGQWKPSPIRRAPHGPYRPHRNEYLFTALQKIIECVEKLEGTNYPSWSYWFKRKATSVPGRKDIWGHIDGTCTRPTKEELNATQLTDGDTTDPIERWDMDEAAIYCALYASIFNTVSRSRIEGCTTAKEVWDSLELAYGDPNAQTTKVAHLLRNLVQGDDLDVMEDVAKRLNGTIVDELALWFVYDSMPGCFATEVQDTRKDKSLSILDAIEKLKALLKTKPGTTHRVNIAALPLDLRHYKYTGNGRESDGQLYVRSRNTCMACLGTGHVALSAKCPQTEARLGLWGRKDSTVTEYNRMAALTGPTMSGNQYRDLALGLPGGVCMTRTISAGPRIWPDLNLTDGSRNWYNHSILEKADFSLIQTPFSNL